MAFNVFNADQCQGFKGVSPIRFESNKDLDKTIVKTGAEIKHVCSDRACYHPSDDIITLPPKDKFINSNGYYATLCHELGHWTGNEKRLGRKLSNQFGSKEYAREELVAELCSYMLMAEHGYDAEPSEGNISYLASWAKLAEDKADWVIFALGQAEKAKNYIMQ